MEVRLFNYRLTGPGSLKPFFCRLRHGKSTLLALVLALFSLLAPFPINFSFAVDKSDGDTPISPIPTLTCPVTEPEAVVG